MTTNWRSTTNKVPDREEETTEAAPPRNFVKNYSLNLNVLFVVDDHASPKYDGVVVYNVSQLRHAKN